MRATCYYYLVFKFSIILRYDAFHACWLSGWFGIDVGSVVLLVKRPPDYTIQIGRWFLRKLKGKNNGA